MLDQLPKTLYAQYRKSMLRVQRQPENYVGWANTVLAWVYSAIRPMKIDELRHALAAIKSKSRNLDREWLIDLQEIVFVCKGLVVIEGGIVRFAHFSVQEFFDLEKTENNKLFVDASQKLASVCLRYLTLGDFTDEIPPFDEEMQQRMTQYPFLRYAASFWYRHNYQSNGGGNEQTKSHIASRLEDLFCSSTRYSYLNWLKVNQPAKEWIGECPWLDWEDIPDEIEYTSRFGLHSLTEKILNIRNEEDLMQAKATALKGFVTNGDITMVKQLLDEGVSPDFQTYTGGSLLCDAVDQQMLLYLLSRGADPNGAESLETWNPLQTSSRNGRFEFVKILYDHGASVPSPVGKESAMHHAVYFGHFEIVEFLLERGAASVINDSSEMGLPAHWCANHGQLQILQLLVKHGADLNAKQDGWSIIECLMGEGPDYIVQGKECGWGRGTELLGVALYLLAVMDIDTIVNARAYSGNTLLHWAAEREFIEVVRLALEKGVDASVRSDVGDFENVTAEEVAETKGYLNIVEVLR
jgi:ankyrin repeat protein